MAFYAGTSRSRGGYTEILKFPAGLDAIASVTLDASTVAADASGNRVLKAGTLLRKNGSNQYEKVTASGQTVAGVLGIDAEFVDGSANSDKSAPMFFHGCVFRATRIVDYATLGAAARRDLTTCRFD